jgi:hypothetical protein
MARCIVKAPRFVSIPGQPEVVITDLEALVPLERWMKSQIGSCVVQENEDLPAACSAAGAPGGLGRYADLLLNTSQPATTRIPARETESVRITFELVAANRPQFARAC